MQTAPTFFVAFALFSLVEVSGFLPSATRVVGTGGNKKYGSTRVHASSDTSATIPAKALGDESSDDIPAVVVAFGLTRQERLATEDTLRRGQVFPAGVRVVSVPASEGTLRQAILSSTNGGYKEPVDEHAREHAPLMTGDTVETYDIQYLPKVLLILSSFAPDDSDEPLLLAAVMEVLDTCDSVPPAIISCPPTSVSWTGVMKGHDQSANETEGTEQLLALFDPALLRTQPMDLWREEAKRHSKEYGLAVPLKTHDTAWNPSEKDIKVVMDLELDGAWVESASSPGGQRWDTSKVLVVDGIVDEKLCRDLLDLVTEPGWATTSKTVGDNNTGRAQAATNEGPPLAKWERGLSDVDSEEASPGMTTLAGADSWGLTNEAIEWLCQEGEHPALVEVQSRLSKLYPDFVISHMPEAVMGTCTPPIVANAPVYGDQFSWHVDADPTVLPPSPWRDHYDTYTNREPGMPLFVSLLLYLDAEWQREWDAETLFLDPPSGTGVFVRPQGGRAVIMDQDVTHRISTPSQIAGRPRYSLVWKLVFNPRDQQQSHLRSPASESTTSTVAAVTPRDSSPSMSLSRGNSALFGSARLPPLGRSATNVPLVQENHESDRPDASSISSVGGESKDACDDGTNHDVHSGNFGGESGSAGEGHRSLSDEQSVDRSLVEVKPVGVKGMGLFAVRAIAEGALIGFYSGEVLSSEELDARYPDFEGSDYVMQVGPDQYLDARDPEKSSYTRYINHSVLSPNLELVSQPEPSSSPADDGHGDERVAFITSREIREGEELTFDYGTEYFDGDDDEGSVIEDGQDMVDLLGGVDWGASGLST